jgi:hypothetical protein
MIKRGLRGSLGYFYQFSQWVRSMRKLLLLVSCIAPALCMASQAPVRAADVHGKALVRKGDDHGGALAAYATAFLTMASESQLLVGPIDSQNPYIVVPVVFDPCVSRNVGWDPQTNSLVIQKSGTYVAEFFVQMQTGTKVKLVDPDYVMALRKTHGKEVTLLAETKLVSTNAVNSFVQTGTHQELLHLHKGDGLQLVLSDLPPSVMPFFSGGTSSSENTAAFLTLIIKSGAED